MSDNNPYATPRAELEVLKDNLGWALLPQPRKLTGSDAVSWISRGWDLFKKDMGIWILIFIAMMAITIVLSFIPIVSVVSGFLMTVFLGGVYMGAKECLQGKKLEFSCLGQGFSTRFGPLLLVYLLQLLLLIGVGIVIVLIAFLIFKMTGNMDMAPSDFTMSSFGVVGVIFVLIISALIYFIYFGLSFMVPLVALNDMPATKALGWSIKGAMKNMWPIFLFTLMAFGLSILGCIPFFLGLILVVPLLYLSTFFAYKEIFIA